MFLFVTIICNVLLQSRETMMGVSSFLKKKFPWTPNEKFSRFHFIVTSFYLMKARGVL